MPRAKRQVTETGTRKTPKTMQDSMTVRALRACRAARLTLVASLAMPALFVAAPATVARARSFVHDHGLGNVSVVEGDARRTGLEDSSFVVVHACTFHAGHAVRVFHGVGP